MNLLKIAFDGSILTKFSSQNEIIIIQKNECFYKMYYAFGSVTINFIFSCETTTLSGLWSKFFQTTTPIIIDFQLYNKFSKFNVS